jgi:signal peptidase I
MALTQLPARMKAGRIKLPADGHSHAEIKLEIDPGATGPTRLRLVASKAPLFLDSFALLLLPLILLIKLVLHQSIVFSQVLGFLVPMALLLALAFMRWKYGNTGSFDPDICVTEMTLASKDTELLVTVYAARYPGLAYLRGPGVVQRVEFVPASTGQAAALDWLPTLIYALLFALVLRTFVVASFYIPSGSMEDTLSRGDLLIADKFSFKVLGRTPQRGEVVIFIYPRWLEENPPKQQDYIKRVIGLPGDTVEVRDHKVYVNGQALNEPYIKEAPEEDFPAHTVPADCFFMMGDNRNRSRDSREWGFVPRFDLEGHALFVFWPPQHAGQIR